MAKKVIKKATTPSRKLEPKIYLKRIVRKMILKESAILEEPDVPKMEFYFKVQPIKKVSKSPSIYIFKPIKEDFIELGCKISISEPHLNIFKSNPEKQEKIYTEIKRICLIKNVVFILQPNFFVLLDRIYLESNKELSMNQYRKTFRNVFNTIIYALDLFKNIGSTPIIEIDDLIRGDPSLYT